MELQSTAIVPHFDQQPLEEEAAFIDSFSSAEQFLMSDDYRFDPDITYDPLLLDNFSVDDVMEEDQFADFATHFPDLQNSDDFVQSSSFGNPIKIPTWPVVPSPYSCACCQSLREFCHINGDQVLKLQVHGRLGMVSHAFLQKYNSSMSVEEDHEYYMLDFCQESMSSIKQFLIQYCNDRRREGYIMLRDPLSNFYDALCIGINGNYSDPDMEQDSPKGDENATNREMSGSVLNKGFIALQRERTAKMSLQDLAGYFHLTMKEASKELGLCMSSIKAICRRGGLKRWPCRKVNSYLSDIAKKKRNLRSDDPNERARALMEIQQLESELARYKDSLVRPTK